MKPRSDEPLTGGTRARNRKGSLSRKGARRCGIVAAALSAAVLLSSCMPYKTPSNQTIDRLRIGDAVVAVRLGKGHSVSGLGGGTGDSGVGLLNERGQARVGYIPEATESELLWNERGLFFGASLDEYMTTDEGTRRTGLTGHRSLEYERYGLPDGRVAVVSGANYWGFRVDIIELDGTITTKETKDTSGDVGQCGERILAITDTQESESIKGSARDAYAAQSGSQTDMPEELAAVVQLDDVVGDEPRVLAVAPMIEGLKSGQFMFACEGDVITMPSVLQDDPVAARNFGVDATTGPMVLQRWDLSTGQRTVIPAFDENGNEITLSKDLTIFGYQAVQVGDEYRFISRRGHAFTVNLRSGQARHLFTIPAETATFRTLFQVTETGVYALDQRRQDYVVTLSYRPWDGGDQREIFSTDELAKSLNQDGNLLSAGYEREIEFFTLRPGWDGGAQ